MIKDDFGVLKLDLEIEKGFILLDFSSFLYDFELLHDFLVLCNLDDYERYIYTPSLWGGFYGGRFWTRAGRPLKNEHRLVVLGIDVHSPGSILLGLGATVVSKTIVPLIEAAGKIADWRFDRKKARFEAEKIQNEASRALLEAEKAKYDVLRSTYEAEKALIERETAFTTYQRERRRLSEEELSFTKENTGNKILKRMEKNPIKLIDLSISRPDKEQDLENI